ncbi:hypothetical protein Nhal_2732 [Nitrosococcus halophilus Nc 4]|uniref:Uncharacterized protein n=1 Tax=Nitrosococcus halophilus (strain Nc4) TaxID=472759 RepID=D5BXB9_NITHN|nr:hypothetical protein [Nitrosococcus halophilus]ADE15802.1 hypothetical protein Nhal_2732 [Nitrosococcus halophilus Nc 4]
MAIACLAKRFVEAEPMMCALGFSTSEFEPFVEQDMPQSRSRGLVL